MNNAEEFEHAGFKIEIWYEEDTSICDPRQWDNLGTMLCWHRRYRLGDEQFQEGDSERLRKILNHKGIVLPLYLFDHSGLRISTSCEHFRAADSAGWDWGKVGYIYVSYEKLRSEYGHNITQKRRELATQVLIAEVEAYDEYLRGECYGYTVSTLDGEDLDCVGGFLGDIEYVKNEAKASADALAKPARKRRRKKG